MNPWTTGWLVVLRGAGPGAMPAPPELAEALGLPEPLPPLPAAEALEAPASAASSRIGAMRGRTRKFSFVGLRG